MNMSNFSWLNLLLFCFYLPAVFAVDNPPLQQDINQILEQIDQEANLYLQGQGGATDLNNELDDTGVFTQKPESLIKSIAKPSNKPLIKKSQKQAKPTRFKVKGLNLNNSKKNASNAAIAGFEKVTQRLSNWSKVWSDGKLNSYISFYTKDFHPGNKSRKQWLESRKKRIKPEKNINIEISDIDLKVIRSKLVIGSQFKQKYSSIHYSDSSKKQLLWKNINGNWFIQSERTIQ
ncbi:MAG: hypothetical protein QM479_07280 [Pseudomonadota bacterium]